MPTLHSSLTGADLHEVKGASAASAGQVYRADGAGSAQFVTPLSLMNIQYASTITNFNSGVINPSATDTPITLGFDSTVANGDVSLDSLGLVTLITGGLYHLTFNLNIGRSTNVSTAKVVARLLINGVQYGFTQSAILDTNASSRPVQFNVVRAFNAGDAVQVQLMRDSSGQNDGGLYPLNVTVASWGDSPSYFVRVQKILGGS